MRLRLVLGRGVERERMREGTDPRMIGRGRDGGDDGRTVGHLGDGSYVCCNTRLNAGGKRGVRLSAVPTSLVGTSWGPVRLSVADTI